MWRESFHNMQKPIGSQPTWLEMERLHYYYDARRKMHFFHVPFRFYEMLLLAGLWTCNLKIVITNNYWILWIVFPSTRNANVFDVNVNIKSQSKVNFNLTYEELLSRRLGRYEQSISITPDQASESSCRGVILPSIFNFSLFCPRLDYKC